MSPSLVAMWMLGGGCTRRNVVPRMRESESIRTKTSRNGKMRTSFRVSILFLPTHGHVSVHAKLIEAGYSGADFPVSNSEWEKTVTKRAQLTDKCNFTCCFLRAVTNGCRSLALEDASEVEGDD